MWYIFRHGETLHNKLDISQGWCQSMLSIKGIDQAKSYGYRLEETKEDFSKYKFISSEMIRTKQTLQIICEILNVPPKTIVEPLLNEIDKGDFTGKYKHEIAEEQAKVIEAAAGDYLRVQYPNGECFGDVYERIRQFKEKYSEEKNIVLVTHGCCVGFLLSILRGQPKDVCRDRSVGNQGQNYFSRWDGEKLERL